MKIGDGVQGAKASHCISTASNCTPLYRFVPLFVFSDTERLDTFKEVLFRSDNSLACRVDTETLRAHSHAVPVQ